MPLTTANVHQMFMYSVFVLLWCRAAAVQLLPVWCRWNNRFICSVLSPAFLVDDTFFVKLFS